MGAADVRPTARRPNRLPQAAGPGLEPRVAPTPVLDLTFDGDGLFRVRSAVAAYADQLGAGAEGGVVVLVAHELCSNAVRHGGGSGRLRLWRDQQGLRCQVSDSGDGMAEPESQGFERPSPHVPGGRGMWIVRRLADVEIDTGPTGTTITVTMLIS